MKHFAFLVCVLLSTVLFAQQKIENLIIITTDGFRWEEVYRGMDSAIANKAQYNQGDSLGIYRRYWSNDAAERRKKLLPFFWSTIVQKGQLYGNRDFGNKINNANPYWFSYPGYNEIMTGYPDSAVNSNDYPPNPNENLLEFLNRQPAFKNKVAAFGAWEAFDRILNERRSGFPVVSAFDACGGIHPSEKEKLINSLLNDSYKPFGTGECLDVFTHYEAMEYLKNKKPKVLYIAYGETDEWAHHGHYRDYLDAAHQVDAWIQDIWNYIQNDPVYRNKTALFITTDHGRGDLNKDEWTSHGSSIQDAYQIWFAVLAPGLPAKGERKQNEQYYQKQFAQTMAKLIGCHFTADHPVGEEIKSVFK
ncbi:MAG TPA: alkaline phosphatase family protein [Chitinophagaceae bacterium]|nr:alkaline phosphatase family protein [Chitinophagaceae bacterium]